MGAPHCPNVENHGKPGFLVSCKVILFIALYRSPLGIIPANLVLLLAHTNSPGAVGQRAWDSGIPEYHSRTERKDTRNARVVGFEDELELSPHCSFCVRQNCFRLNVFFVCLFNSQAFLWLSIFKVFVV